uniref:PH domain-containing protein n=1 Tax=Oreochromis niloticus TaxID=8128 RepID=A0A669BSV7_ORENI
YPYVLSLCISGSGGFIFKQWKKRFLLITAEGSLLVCHDASSPPSQLVLLQNSCEAIVEGKEILDLPKLPSGGSRDCCFALILPQNKYLLLLAETSDFLSHTEKNDEKLKNEFNVLTCP